MTLDASPQGSYYYALATTTISIDLTEISNGEHTEGDNHTLLATVTTMATVMQRGDTPNIKNLWNLYNVRMRTRYSLLFSLRGKIS